uniref:Autophagy-related protein 9 n=1 Tax=Heterorhabditis bacteriophora TaxID=37862 RepID=A0A1I7XMP8_HETBA
MRLAHTLGGSSGGSECETYEFAEEAKQTEPLRFMNQQIVTHALASELLYVDLAVLAFVVNLLMECILCPVGPITSRLFFSFDFDHDSCANPDAARMWKEYEHKFRDIAKDCVNQSRIQIYDDPQDINDPNSIRLTPWDPSVHEPVRERMMMLGSNHRGEGSSWGERSSERRGFSWIDTEEMTYMTESMSSKSNIDQDNSILKAENDRLMHGIEKLDLSGVLNDDSSEWSTKSQVLLLLVRSINQSPLPSSNVSNLIDEHVELEKIVSDHEAHEERVK